MSNLKDTDFDDLFRRASDKYPLRTDSSDWHRMNAALDNDPPPGSDDDPDNSDRRKRRRFFWLFLLLPLGGAGYFVLHQAGHGSRAGQSPDAIVVTHAAAGTDHGAGTGAGSGNTQPATTATIPASGNTQPATGAATPASANPNASTANTPAATITDRPVATTPSAHNRKRFDAGNTNGGDAAYTTTTHIKTAGSTNADNTVDNSTDNFSAGNSASHTTTPVASAFTLRSSAIDEPLARTSDPWRLAVDVKAPPKTVDSTKKQSAKKQRSSYFYAGAFVSPDFSTVKFQQMKGVGTTFGILLGYAFNAKWAVETGVYLDRKRYYTEGQYFKHESWGPNMTLENVDGTCYMWEIPLNVRYNFNPSGKTKWFGTAGLSTYLMTRENYVYQLSWTTWSGDTTITKNSKKPSQYPFSVINLSAGFEQSLGRVGNLRVEPYIRVPLGGIGTGKLPIMSAGINIGITKRLWKK